jgi:pimeloyl-ACP methyl ester carboxylesterase
MRTWIKLAAGAGLIVGSAAVFNDWARWKVGPVRRCVAGEPHFYQWREGAIYYEVAGPRDGFPLLLVHGFNAAASSCEMQCVFSGLAAAGFRVYLPDLLGYGRSERPATLYTAETYVDLWSDFVRDGIIPAGGRPPHVVASSLSAAHLVAAAARHPERFGHLLLVCPTGIRALATSPGLPSHALHALLTTPTIGTALFNLLVTRPVLDVFLRRQAYADAKMITPPLIEDYYTTSHQPGAKWAPLAFVTGYLNCSMAQAFASLPNPVYLAWGRQATVTPLAQAEDFRSLRPGLPVEVFERSALLPHQEEPDAFVRWVVRSCQ